MKIWGKQRKTTERKLSSFNEDERHRLQMNQKKKRKLKGSLCQDQYRKKREIKYHNKRNKRKMIVFLVICFDNL